VATDVTERRETEEALRQSEQQLRALSAHLQAAREDERAQIAREIHDEFGQALTSLKLDLAWFESRLHPAQIAILARINAMRQLIDNTFQALHRISSALRPPVLDELGVEAAIEWQTSDFQSRTGIQCAFTSTWQDLHLDQERSTAAFRILQETLTNVARHAKASQVTVSLRRESEEMIMEVSDDGIGIRQSDVGDPNSLGLLGIRERACCLGGRVDIHGASGRGTMVTVRFPLTSAQKHCCERALTVDFPTCSAGTGGKLYDPV